MMVSLVGVYATARRPSVAWSGETLTSSASRSGPYLWDPKQLPVEFDLSFDNFRTVRRHGAVCLVAE